MILLFDPDPPLLRWCKVENGNITEHRCEFDSAWDEKVLGTIDDVRRIEAVGYVLYHGGQGVREPAILLTPESLLNVEKSMQFLPEHNDMIVKVAGEWIARLINIPHIVVCDTGFFAGMPSEASAYAVPFELRRKGIRRYGGYGLCHQWVWEKSRSLRINRCEKLISVYLGDRTNVAAIRNGRAIESSIGFTPAEGMLSSNSCGDIDPTIVFQLISAGMSLEEINQALSQEAGFTGLLGRPCGFLDLLGEPDDSQVRSVKEIFLYALRKYIGAFVSILGGVDVIAFATKYPEQSMDVQLDILRSLEFLGIKKKTIIDPHADHPILTEKDSPIGGVCYHYDKWNVINERVKQLRRNGSEKR